MAHGSLHWAMHLARPVKHCDSEAVSRVFLYFCLNQPGKVGVCVECYGGDGGCVSLISRRLILLLATCPQDQSCPYWLGNRRPFPSAVLLGYIHTLTIFWGLWDTCFLSLLLLLVNWADPFQLRAELCQRNSRYSVVNSQTCSLFVNCSHSTARLASPSAIPF